MPANAAADRLRRVRTFEDLVVYLRDELDWPVETDEFDELTFDWEPAELGLDLANAAKIRSIRQFRPLDAHQPWGIFFVQFEPRGLPVVALRRILRQLVLRKRASATPSERRTWKMNDLLFISSHGEREDHQLTFAHFREPEADQLLTDLPILRVLGWDGDDTGLKLDHVAEVLHERLTWPQDASEVDSWRRKWSSAFELRPREVVRNSKDLAERLAALARAIRIRARKVLELESADGPLRRLHAAFRATLLHDLSEEDFADTYAQTITYGLFSAAVARGPARGWLGKGDLLRQVPVTNPFLREIFDQFLRAGGRRSRIDFDELGVQDVVDLLSSPSTHLDDILRDFGNRTRQEDPVVHFYEDFLAAYDKRKKVERGVFYTPRPVVSYIVRSVHELLQSEFGLEDGLASTVTWGEMAGRHKGMAIPAGVRADEPFVQVLDPATGTATFLVEVIDVIHRTMLGKWKKQKKNELFDVPALWNEYVARHLLPRLCGYELMMAPYAIAHLKLGLKLAETGYAFQSEERARVYLTNALEPASDFSGDMEFIVPALAHEAEEVNRVKRERRFTVVVGNPPYSASVSEPSGLIEELEVWKEGLDEAKSDLRREEWKFLRMAQLLTGASPCSVVGVIINRDFLDGIAKRKLRESLQSTFANRVLVDLNGDVKGNITDDNVFDITQGVAIALLCRGGEPRHSVYSLQGTRQDKYRLLSEKLELDSRLEALEPEAPYFRWIPLAGGARSADVGHEYAALFPINNVFGVYSSGIQTKNDGVCIGWTAEEIFDRVSFLVAAPPDQVKRNLSIGEGGVWSLAAAREDIRTIGLSKSRVRRILYRPFDWRFTYFTSKSGGFLGRPRFDVMKHMADGTNVGLIFNRQIVGDSVSQFGVSRDLICHGTFYLGNKGQDYLAPLYLLGDGDLKLVGARGRPDNFTGEFLAVLRKNLGCEELSKLAPELIFQYLYAIVHCPKYRERYHDHLKLDFPRVPLTSCISLFLNIARIGGELVSLHLMDTPLLDTPLTHFLGALPPTVEKVTYRDATVFLDSKQTTGFRGVPEAVWNFHVGGYPVCEKWLKDRKGRSLTGDEIRHYHRIVVAIRETLRLMTELDEVIAAHGGFPAAFQEGKAVANVPAGAWDPTAEARDIVPFRILREPDVQPFVNCVPLYLLAAAAGKFGPEQAAEEPEAWVLPQGRTRPGPDLFVARVKGESMNRRIPNGAFCLFRANPSGELDGRVVLVQHREVHDVETGGHFTVKVYGRMGDPERVVLKPDTSASGFEPIVLNPARKEEVRVIAELVEILGPSDGRTPGGNQEG